LIWCTDDLDNVVVGTDDEFKITRWPSTSTAAFRCACASEGKYAISPHVA
jgi:hypothetical protein